MNSQTSGGTISPFHQTTSQSPYSNPFRRGCKIKVFSTKTSTCPYHAMKCYRRPRSPSYHLFQSGRSHPLSRSAVTNTLRDFLKTAGLHYSLYASHSFHIGATITVAADGLPAWLIKNLGRWSSNAYLKYIYQQPSLSSKIYELLSYTDASNQPTWEPDSQAA